MTSSTLKNVPIFLFAPHSRDASFGLKLINYLPCESTKCSRYKPRDISQCTHKFHFFEMFRFNFLSSTLVRSFVNQS